MPIVLQQRLRSGEWVDYTLPPDSGIEAIKAYDLLLELMNRGKPGPESPFDYRAALVSFGMVAAGYRRPYTNGHVAWNCGMTLNDNVGARGTFRIVDTSLCP